MTDEEIRRALANFPEVWRRVGGEAVKLPEELVLMSGKNGKSQPVRGDPFPSDALYSAQDSAMLILLFSILIFCLLRNR